MKLKSYQPGGGLVYTPFIPEQYVNKSTSKSSSSEDSETSKLDPLDKELLSLMKDQNLLPSDVNKIYTQIIAFQRRTQNLTDLGGSTSYRSVMPGMLQIMQLVQNAKYNKLKSDEAIKQMTSQNAGADVALDKYGRMYVQDGDGKIKHIAPSEYDDKKYRPISNSELLYLRENSLPFDTDILSDITQTVGLSDISKEINRIIKDFGKTSSERYYDKETVKMFTALNSPDGIYKLMEEKSSADLRKAWNVIYKQLPTKMQHVLNARAALSDSNPVDYIHEIVLSNLDYTQQLNYDATQSKAAGFDTDPLKAEKEKAEQLTQNNYLQQIGTKRLMKSKAVVVPAAAQISDTAALLADVYMAGMPVDKSMKGIGMMTLSRFRTEAEASKAGDFSSVTFGNRILRPEEYDAVLYDGNSELNIAMLPYTYDQATGQIMPDMNLFAAFNYIQKLISDNPNISKTELNQKAREKGYSLEQLGYNYDTNTMTLPNTMPFITFSAFASDDAIKIPKTMKPFLEKLSWSQGKSIMQKYKLLINYGQINPSKNDRKLNNFNNAERWDFYKGNVYVPMSDAARSLLLSGIGEFVPKSSMTDYAARVRARQEEVNIARAAQNSPEYDIIANLGQFN